MEWNGKTKLVVHFNTNTKLLDFILHNLVDYDVQINSLTK